MSKAKEKLAYAVPTAKYADSEAWRFINRIRKNPFPADQELAGIISLLREKNPFIFEEIVLNCCKYYKYFVIPKKGFTKDNGIDGGFAFHGRFYVVQCKLYKAEANPDHIRYFEKAIGWHQAARGFFFHTGKSNDDFREAVQEAKYLQVISGRVLVDFLMGRKPLYLIGQYQKQTKERTVPSNVS